MAEAAERKVYEAGAGRKTFLSLVFLILLPFYASLPAMLIQRLTRGLHCHQRCARGCRREIRSSCRIWPGPEGSAFSLWGTSLPG